MSVESNLNPLSPLTKSFVSIIPLEFKVKLLPTIVLELNVQPPIVPEVDFNTPPLVTLNGAEPNVACPN